MEQNISIKEEKKQNLILPFLLTFLFVISLNFVSALPTTTGEAISNIGYYFILLLLTYGIGLFGFFGKNIWVSILGGMSMIAFGIYTITQGITIYINWVTNFISIISIGLGSLFLIYPIVEWIEPF